MEDSLVVNVEKVRVETGLEDSGEDNNGFRSLAKQHPPDPVQQVEGTVGTQGHQVMRSNGFSLSCLLEKEHLRENGNGFKEDGEGPQELKRNLDKIKSR